MRNTHASDSARRHRSGWCTASLGALVALTMILPMGAPSPSWRSFPRAGDGTHAAARANSADRVVVWTTCTDLVTFKDSDLERWRERGVGGLACGTSLRGFGGDEAFTTASDTPDGKEYGLQSALVRSRIGERARAYDLKLYLGFGFTNKENRATPLVDWFDDRAWADALPRVAALAAVAHRLGFAGLSLDQELYPQNGGVRTATWDWDYPGNSRAESDVRAMARRRGSEMMTAIVGAFPGVQVQAYDSHFPETWDELVQHDVNDLADANRKSLHLDFWAGMMSARGYGAIRFVNAIFYKTTHIDGASWDTAYTYEYNRLFALFSREIPNWAYAADRVFESPFVWISSGSSGFESARPPDYVAEQLDAAHRWGMGREFADFAYNGLDAFDYAPYVPAMRAAAQPKVVDSTRPSVEVTDRRLSGTAPSRHLDLAGRARDDLAVRVVRWRTSTGASGTAELEWDGGAGNEHVGFPGWHTSWRVRAIPVATGTRTVTISVEDIHGLVTSRVVTIPR